MCTMYVFAFVNVLGDYTHAYKLRFWARVRSTIQSSMYILLPLLLHSVCSGVYILSYTLLAPTLNNN